MPNENREGEALFTTTKSKEHKIVRKDRGILYFEGGWWCHESDWWKAERNKTPRNGYHTVLRANKETKQIELDGFILPT